MDKFTGPPLSADRRGVLVVEDNEADFTLLKRELERLDIRVVSSAGSKKEVNDLLAGKTKEASLPAVMFVDISLPDGDARDCLEEWRKKLGRGTLIVLTTGSLRGEDLRTLYQRGADTFLAKPISSGDLEHLIVFYGRFFAGADKF